MIYLLAAPCGTQERSSWDCTDTQTGGEASDQLWLSASPLPWAGWGTGRAGAAASQAPCDRVSSTFLQLIKNPLQPVGRDPRFLLYHLPSPWV